MTKLVNRAKMTTAAPAGTGTITLGSAVDGYQTFANAGVANADVVRYVIEDGDAWEIGLGTYSAGTLTRGSIESSNSDLALNLTGNAVVFVSAAAADLQELVDFADNFVLPTADGSTGQVLTTNGAGTLTFSTITGYTDADVDTHLNTGTAASGEVLSWTGTDYDWIAAGGGAALELYAENPVAAIPPSATGSNAVAIGSNTEATGDRSMALIDGANATGLRGFAVGFNATASGSNSVAMGASAVASVSGAFAIGPLTDATSTNSLAIGHNAQTATGASAVAIGQSYASGTDSLAAAIANNSSSYGATGANSVAIGNLAKATASGAMAFGDRNTASGEDAVVFGESNTGSGPWSFTAGRLNTNSASRGIALGNSHDVSGFYTTALGSSNTASQNFCTAIGSNSLADKQGKLAHASLGFGTDGDAQYGRMVLSKATTDATPVALTSIAGNAASDINQIILPNNSAYSFHGTIVARQQASAGTACAAWKIEGLIRREGSAGTTVLVNSATTVLDNTPAWGMTLSADTTNGGLKIEVTGAAATNIRWVATIHTSEVIY